MQVRVPERLQQRVELWCWIIAVNPGRQVVALLVEFLFERPETLTVLSALDPRRRLSGQPPHGIRMLLAVHTTACPGECGGGENEENLWSSSRGGVHPYTMR